MKVLISKANEGFIKERLLKVKFYESTKTTSIFMCNVKTFQQLHSEVVMLGINPYALMSW